MVGVVAVGVAVAWVLSAPSSFELREGWKGSQDPEKSASTIEPERFARPLAKLVLALGQAPVGLSHIPIPLGDVVIPPGRSTQGKGEAAEDIPGSWPQFLGPKRNALSTDFTVLADSWPASGPPVLWSVELGPGHAGPVIYDGRVYVLDYQADPDMGEHGDALRCLSMKDGREIWRYWYPNPLADDHGISRSVPAIADDYVVTFGPGCHVMCTDALTGKYQWWMNLVEQYDTRVPGWYAAQCPLIDSGRAIIATGGKKLMIAVNLAPEKEGRASIAWEVDNPMPGKGREAMHITHSSIVPMTFKGKPVYLYCTTKGIVGVTEVQSDEGEVRAKLLWHYSNWRPGINATSPVVLDAERFAVAASEGGLILRMVERPNGAIGVEDVANTRAKVLSSYHHTPILDGGYLYVVLSQKAGALRGQLACLDVRGPGVKTLWTSGRDNRFRWGPYLKAGDRMLLLNDQTGVLTMARVSPSGYTPLARAKLLTGHDAWAPMALVSGRLLLRDVNRMICVDLRAGRPAPAPGTKATK